VPYVVLFFFLMSGVKTQVFKIFFELLRLFLRSSLFLLLSSFSFVLFFKAGSHYMA
jgi:hypothetical protein